MPNLALITKLGLLFVAAVAVHAADGDLDTSFGGSGKVTVSALGNVDAFSTLAIQPDRKIIAAGYGSDGSNNKQWAMFRFNVDGTVDSTFAANGRFVSNVSALDDYLYDVAIQSDGKIVVSGDNGKNFSVARFNSNGSLDTSFSGGIVVNTLSGVQSAAESVAIQPDGKIVAAGSDLVAPFFQMVVARYKTDGSLDSSFGTGGITHVDFGENVAGRCMLIQPDGKIVVAGETGSNHFALARFNANGTLDTDFNVTGKVVTPNAGGATEIAIQSNGQIIAAGTVTDRMTFVRYNSDGSVDTNFGTAGSAQIPIGDNESHCTAVLVQSDGKILGAGYALVGNQYDFALARLLSDGTPDTSFGTGGKVTTAVIAGADAGYAMVLQPGGKIVMAGATQLDAGNHYGCAVVQYLNSVNTAPQITSAASAAPNSPVTGQSVTFSVIAADADGDTLTYSWDFGDGMNATGASVTHSYSAAGTYTVIVTVTDGQNGAATSPITILVIDAPIALDVKKLGTKLNFAKVANDQISLSGTLALADGTAVGGKTITIDVGGVNKTFTLDAKGKVKAGGDSVAVKAPKKGAAGYSVKFTKGDFAQMLADEGLTNANATKASKQIVVTILFDGKSYRKVQPQVYRAKQGKSGSSK